jgi:VWFA-related protein
VILSDGADVKSSRSIGDAIEFAQRADTIIYSILFANRQIIGPPGAMAGYALYLARGKRVMRRLADETGGEYFVVSKNNPLENVYAQIEDDLRNEYTIGYVSDAVEETRFRKTMLTTKRRDLVVRTRRGYYPK